MGKEANAPSAAADGDECTAAASSTSSVQMHHHHHHHHHHHVASSSAQDQPPVLNVDRLGCCPAQELLRAAEDWTSLNPGARIQDLESNHAKRARLQPPPQILGKRSPPPLSSWSSSDSSSAPSSPSPPSSPLASKNAGSKMAEFSDSGAPPLAQQQQDPLPPPLPPLQNPQSKLVLRDDQSSSSGNLLDKAVRGLWKLTARNDCAAELLQCCPDFPEIIVKELASAASAAPIEASLLGTLVNISSTESGRAHLRPRPRPSAAPAPSADALLPPIVNVLLMIMHDYAGHPLSSTRLAIAATANLCHSAEFAGEFVRCGIFSALGMIVHTGPSRDLIAQLADLVHVVLAFVPSNTLAPLRGSFNDFLKVLEPLADSNVAMGARRLALLELFHSRVYASAVSSAPIARRMHAARQD